MGEILKIVTPLHQATERDYLGRMVDKKVECMQKARLYGSDYWDGERRFGYGGYRYITGWWKPVAEALIGRYQLSSGSQVLDVGCGKGFLLHEMKLLEPGLKILGFDLSKYALANAKSEIQQDIFYQKAQNNYAWEDNSFDLIVSLGCLHNLRLPDLSNAISEIERVGRNKYIMVESYRSEQELFNLQCWALTAETFLDAEEWIWLYKKFGYTGDYEFIFFE